MVFQTICWELGTAMGPIKVGVDPDKGANAGTSVI